MESSCPEEAAKDAFPPSQQRPSLLELAVVLRSSSTALRRDECGDWRLLGKRGHIYATPSGFQLIVSSSELGSGAGSARRWGFIKKDLSFAKLCGDGDDEGTFILDRLPSQAEADVILNRLGIRRAPAFDAATLERLRAPIIGPLGSKDGHSAIEMTAG